MLFRKVLEFRLYTALKSNLEQFLSTKKEDEVTMEDETAIDKKVIVNPIKGTIIPITEVKDVVFSSEMLGKGFAVEPSEGKTYAPLDGKITAVFDTKHAIGIEGTNGVEVLIHMGLDTVKLVGEGFDVKVKVGDEVKAGDLLATFDIGFIKGKGYLVTTPVIVSNTDAFAEVGEPKTGEANVGDVIVAVQ